MATTPWSAPRPEKTNMDRSTTMNPRERKRTAIECLQRAIDSIGGDETDDKTTGKM